MQTKIRPFKCRDIGYGIERGHVFVPPLSAAPDWTGKHTYQTHPARQVVYLFDDEVC
jgi:hypothetical protein